MGVRFPANFSNVFVGPYPATNAETIVLALGPISPSIDNAPIFLFWLISAIAGTTVTSFNVKIRRGTTTGGFDVTAGGITYPATAGAALACPGVIIDTPGLAADQQYVLTVVQTGATGASTPGQNAMLAMVL